MNNKLFFKEVWIYAFIALFTIIVNQVYSIFSHDVASPSMTWMFLYPLIGGSTYLFVAGIILSPHLKTTNWRVFFNLHHSGVATLTIASFLQGVFEIAGTDSPYLIYYYYVGWGFIGIAFIIFCMKVLLKK